MARISFEVFPARTEAGEHSLWQTLERLTPLRPAFVSVTCGAGGGSIEATLGVLERLQSAGWPPAAGHITCVGRSRAQTDAQLERYWQAGVRHVVALRGDPPAGKERFTPHPDGYRTATDLVAGISQARPFEISVAAYPEPHPDSQSTLHDLRVLAAKAQAGATRAITQFCFDTAAIVRLRDRIAAADIPLTLAPGILLATDFQAVSRMAGRCGASLPPWLEARFAGLEDEPEARSLTGAIVAAAQVERLAQEGFDEFHFYTLNRSDLALAVCRLLGAGAATARSAA
jgi:methylenetetrahydrofolate reductase (NADPH)